MADDDDQIERKGFLWSNLQICKRLGGFTWHDIASQMGPFLPGISIDRLAESLRIVASRRQVRWKYSEELASALGIDEFTLLHVDFVRFENADALRDEAGFDARSVISQWKKNSQKPGKWAVTSFSAPLVARRAAALLMSLTSAEADHKTRLENLRIILLNERGSDHDGLPR